MDIAAQEVQGRVKITVLQPKGDLDGHTYQELIGKAQQAYAAGARAMIIDLAGVRFLSSAGLVAIHSIARLLQGQEVLDPEAGWSAMHKVKNEVAGKQLSHSHLKLANPQPAVDKVLQMAGFKAAFETYTDMEAAVASF